jgi:hypothetical protein
MSQRNGDRARFQINRKRKLRNRQRVRALFASAAEPKPGATAADQPDGGSKPRQK